MAVEVPDTSVLIGMLRDTHRDDRLIAFLQSRQVFLSSVVLTELYAGSRSPFEGEVLDALAEGMRARKRLLTPTHEDWVLTGQLINRYVRLFGSMRPRDHMSDALIVVSAGRVGGIVRTHNVQHMQTWAQLARGAHLTISVEPAPA